MKKFTLIELLVVIAIIGILASILMPSLSKARHVAIQTVCISNQNQLSTGAMMYVDDSDGLLMPYKATTNSPYTQGHPHNNYYLRFTSSNSPAANHGLLYKEGYIESPEVFYCPGLAMVPNKGWISSMSYYVAQHGHYPTREEFQVSSGVEKVRGSYYFNPYGQTKTYTRITEYDPSLIMFMDLIRGDSLPHGGIGQQWVVAMGDGSVKVAKSKAAYSAIQSGDVSGNWSDYNSALQLLTEAAR
ncbi:MAG: type II secretion system GspH family protein [Lentisphaeraceae bacterium]|nr:type II secretion system GspH family protein [Lentisphaeraceae bacterium]